MIGAGTVINPIIKIVTVVAVLGASYLFIVKPVLDTTESTIESSFESFSGFEDLPAQIQGQVDQAFEVSGGSNELQRCIQRALRGGTPDTERINRCVSRFGG